MTERVLIRLVNLNIPPNSTVEVENIIMDLRKVSDHMKKVSGHKPDTVRVPVHIAYKLKLDGFPGEYYDDDTGEPWDIK